jgi:hypothetical protein
MNTLNTTQSIIKSSKKVVTSVLTDYAIYYPLTTISSGKVKDEKTGLFSGTLNGTLSGSASLPTISNLTYVYLPGSLQLSSASAQYVSLLDYVNSTTTISMSIWFRLTSLPGNGIYPYIIGMNNNGNYIGIYINASNAGTPGRLAIFIQGNVSPNVINLPYVIPTNQWIHIAWVIEGTSSKIYLDGVLYNSSTMNTVVVTKTRIVTLGGGASGTSHYINGFLQDFRVYERAITATEVTNIYNFRG